VKPHVALVGFMAAGKTTVGKRLARDLGWRFVDTDDLVVAARGRSIDAIFADEGEDAFRRYEFEAAREAVSGSPAVVALGGGAVTHPPTRDLVAGQALRVYLELELPEILMRLRRARRIRPLAGPRPARARIGALLAARTVFYREAEIVVHVGRRSAGQVAREILERLAPLTQEPTR
jgi:shikimate kinase